MNHKETKFRTQLVKLWTAMGAKCFVVHGHGMQEAGWPDVQIYSLWWTGHLEFKVDTNTCQTNQKLCIRDLRARRTPAFCIRLKCDMVTIEDEEGNVLRHVCTCWDCGLNEDDRDLIARDLLKITLPGVTHEHLGSQTV